uniref:C2 domain-containing protein n=1 Tax=Fagus sylvatica TaxID=28930 RepID=A0A2N9I219_FAGSY
MEEPGSDPQLIYLHGDLELKIIEAKDLPNMDLVVQHFRRCFTGLVTLSIHVTPPPNPTLVVKDDDIFGSELIGTVEIPARDIVSGDLISDWFPLNGSFKKHKPEIRIEMKFTPFEENPAYKHGIASDPEHRGVRHTYFPLRKGGSLRLYQDAHVPDGFLPKIELDRGKVYEQEKCWEDICYAISEAHHLIYIVGWSVFHKVKLVRERSRSLPRGGDLTLGELLKYKSEEGVRVLLLVWDDKTSHDKFFINTAGMMQTHDEETKKFFKHSSVTCVLAPRYASSKMGYFKQQVNLFYSL